MLTIKQSTAILNANGITVFNRYGKRYSLRREHPGYGTPESRNPLSEWFSVTDCSLADVRAMADAYVALSWPETRGYAEICRNRLRDAWDRYQANRIDSELRGQGWTLPDDPPEAVALIQARGSERAHWHIHRVWQEITRRRLSAIAAEATPC